MVKHELLKVKFSNKYGNKQQKEICILFGITYHLILKNFGNNIWKNIYLLYMNEEAKTVFTPGPMISFRNAKKLSSYLIRAKLYSIERTVGWFKCNGKRCQTCLNVNETDTLTSTTTGETYEINHQFNCNSKCPVYFLTCKVCLK